MALYTVECFKNSGFTPGNVPDSLTTLRAASNTFTLPAVWVLQNRDRASVKLAVNYDTIKNVDYCLIGDMYYWVTSVAMHNENMAEIFLQPDYLTSVGINNMIITSGWCTRRHVTTDNLFTNTIDEAFSPSEPLSIDVDASNTLTPGSDRSSYNIITSTVDLGLPDIATTARTFTDQASALTVTVPIIPPAPYASKYNLAITEGVETYSNSKMPSTMAFNGDDATVKANIQAVRSLGIEQAITGAYNVPKCYVETAVPDSNGKGYIGFTSVVATAETNLNPVYQSGVKNKKAFSGQFQRICVASTASSGQAEFEAHDIWDSGNFKFRLFADLMVGGRPYCRPHTYHGNTSNLFLGAIEGGVWQNQPLALEAGSGTAVSTLGTRRNLQAGTISANYGMVMDLAKGGMGVVDQLTSDKGSTMGAIGAGAGGLFNAVSGIVRNSYRLGEMNFQQQIRNNVVAPNVAFALSPGLQNYFGNFFFAYRYRLSTNDTIRFDNYLTQFGYAVNEPLTTDCFQGRANFNFVQATGVNIDSPHPVTMRLGAIEQISQGVRVWHTTPNIGAMYDNPIS